MPFSLWITKADTYAAAHGEAVRALREPLEPYPQSRVLDRGKLLAILSRSVCAAPHAPDRAFWVRHRDTREPWFSLFTTPHEGPLRHIELSASYSNVEFMANMLNMFDFGLRIARELGAKLFEEWSGSEIRADNIDSFLDLKGKFVTGQHDFWRIGYERILANPSSLLEFPLGAIDEVPDYLSFKFRLDAPPALDALVANLPEHLEAKALTLSAILIDRESKQEVVRIIRFDDGLIVRPYWSRLPFSHLAREVFRAVDRFERDLGAEVFFFDEPVSRHERAELEAQTSGLGVEFYEWLISE